jgi:hypothetical protein
MTKIAFTKRVSTGDYEFEEVTIERDLAGREPQEVLVALRQAAFNGLAVKLKARIDAEEVLSTPSNPVPVVEDEKPKRIRRTKAQIAADEAKAAAAEDDPFAEETTENELDAQMDEAVAKDDDDFDFDEEPETLIRKADVSEVRAVLNNVAKTISRETAQAILTKGGFQRLAECNGADPVKLGDIVTAGEKALADAAKKA